MTMAIVNSFALTESLTITKFDYLWYILSIYSSGFLKFRYSEKAT